MITKHNDFSAPAVCFSKLRKNKNGGRAVYLNINDGKKLYLQLPKMRSPFGLSEFVDEATGKKSYSLDLSFDSDNADATALCAKFVELDNTIVETVAKNSKEWLGKSYNVAVIKEALYKPLVRPGKDAYPSTIKLKVLTGADGTFVPEAYNTKREKLSLDAIEKGQRVTCIVDFVQIWFIDNKFGVTVRLQQVLLEPSVKLPAFAFLDAEQPPAEDEAEEEPEDQEVDE